jgi:LuxR family maltose regulon positive regulatory protein
MPLDQAIAYALTPQASAGAAAAAPATAPGAAPPAPATGAGRAARPLTPSRDALASAPAARPPASAQGLIEPLSDRELDVLRLLAAGLTNPEIARELIVSLATVKTHVLHVFQKFEVNDRRAAARRARELRLV